MPDENTRTNHASRAKLALAIGLAVVFLVVVVVQARTYSGDTRVPTGIDGQQAASPNAAVTPGRTHADPANIESPERTVSWPEVELADCIGHDPFATPDGFLPEQEVPTQKTDSQAARQREIEMAQKQAAAQQAISELMQAGVNAILIGPDRTTAILGTYRLQVGEEIHGHRVVAIEPDGIILEPIAPTP